MSGFFVLGFITIIVDSIRIFASSHPSKHSSHYLIASLTLGLSVLSTSVPAWTIRSKKSFADVAKAAFRGRRGRASDEAATLAAWRRGKPALSGRWGPRSSRGKGGDIGAYVGPALFFLSAGVDREAYPVATSPDRGHGRHVGFIFFFSFTFLI